jgi:isopentenyldiphosphate isomerase
MSQEYKEKLDIYNSDGEFQNRTIFRGQTLKNDEFLLVIHIWIKNSKNEYLITKRAETLTYLPNIWATTGGCVMSGENSQKAAMRELLEELGIIAKEEDFKKVFRFKRQNLHEDVWLLQKDISTKDIILDKDEVSSFKWVTKNHIFDMVKTGTFLNYGRDYFAFLFN